MHVCEMCQKAQGESAFDAEQWDAAEGRVCSDCQSQQACAGWSVFHVKSPIRATLMVLICAQSVTDVEACKEPSSGVTMAGLPDVVHPKYEPHPRFLHGMPGWFLSPLSLAFEELMTVPRRPASTSSAGTSG